MAQVSLQINGYGYFLACGDGEEDHLLALAADLDRRIDDIKAATGPSGEARLLLMTALMLADELHDLRQRTGTTAPAAKSGAKLGKRLRGITKKAEAIADAATAAAPHDAASGGTAANGTAQSDMAHGDATQSGANRTGANQSKPTPREAAKGGASKGDGSSGYGSSGDGSRGDGFLDDASLDGMNSGAMIPGDGGHGAQFESKATDQVVEPSQHH
jgi:cell division protein ZapA